MTIIQKFLMIADLNQIGVVFIKLLRCKANEGNAPQRSILETKKDQSQGSLDWKSGVWLQKIFYIYIYYIIVNMM